MRRLTNHPTRAIPGLGAVLLLGACSNDESTTPTPRAPKDAIPSTATVDASQAVLGVALGKLRTTADVETFQITSTPVTVGQYAQCVHAGVCGAAKWDVAQCIETPGSGVDGPTAEVGVEGAPLTCVSPKQAAKYCSWVGGRLPTAAEWLLAARGKTPSRYAWGSDAPSCDRQWRVSWTSFDELCCGVKCDAAATTVGQHAAGNSAAGLSDVLSAPAELIGSGGPTYTPCSKFGCLVTGHDPGAIDRFVPLETSPETGDREAAQRELRRELRPASFRCVLPVRNP